MAELVLGIGTSHSPMLSLAPEHWDIRTDADRAEPAHPYRGRTYSFDELLEIQPRDEFAKLNAIEVRAECYERCQMHLDTLAATISEVDPDVLVIIGDDQREWYLEDTQPGFTVYYGDSVFAAGFDAETADIPAPMVPVRLSYRPPADTNYPVNVALASTIIDQTITDEFDIATSRMSPARGDGPVGISHAYGFIYRRLLNDRPVPFVPVLINTYYPPNQPTAKRCYGLGRSIGRAIEAWDADLRVGVVASGGLTHFVIDQDFDAQIIEAMKSGDLSQVIEMPNSAFQSGTSEIKNWIAACGVLEGSGLKINVLDYIPCYRSEAGTGTAMCFAAWS